MNKPWSNCSNRFIVVLIFPGGPFNLKLIPNKPSPTSFGMTILPITGIFEIILLSVFAGTNVPFKLVTDES